MPEITTTGQCINMEKISNTMFKLGYGIGDGIFWGIIVGVVCYFFLKRVFE